MDVRIISRDSLIDSIKEHCTIFDHRGVLYVASERSISAETMASIIESIEPIQSITLTDHGTILVQDSADMDVYISIKTLSDHIRDHYAGYIPEIRYIDLKIHYVYVPSYVKQYDRSIIADRAVKSGYTLGNTPSSPSH